MKQIIVNADDFGINEAATSEIKRMIEIGAISSTTIMANGTSLEEVRRFAPLHPEASFGVHLCLSEFDSVTKSDGLYNSGITDENGRFIRMAVFHLNNLKDSDVQRAICDELNAQIDIVKSLGIAISHADSHHHVHTIYPLKEVFANVLRNRGIPKIRLGGSFETLRMKAHIDLWLRRVSLNKFYKNHFITTNAFLSYADFINAGCHMKEDDTLELMCHPGHPGIDFKNEMVLVENKKALKEAKLISYNELF